MNALVLFYSTFGHVYHLAQAVAEGIREVPGARAAVRRVPETLRPDVITALGATEAQKAFLHVPLASSEDLAAANAIVFGIPTRFGDMTSPMRRFLGPEGGLLPPGALAGKVGSIFTNSEASVSGQHPGFQGFHVHLLHHGLVMVGPPRQPGRHGLGGTDTQGTASAEPRSAGPPAREDEFLAARLQGRHVALVAKRLLRPASTALGRDRRSLTPYPAKLRKSS